MPRCSTATGQTCSGGPWFLSTYDGETNPCERCEDKYCPYHHEPNNTPGKLGGHQCVGKDGPKLATLENWRKIVKHETKIENYMEALLRENVGDAPVTPYSGYLGACKKDLSTRWLHAGEPNLAAPNHHYYPRWG